MQRFLTILVVLLTLPLSALTREGKNIVELNRFTTHNGYLQEYAIAGNFTYQITNKHGVNYLQVVDHSNPSQPKLIHADIELPGYVLGDFDSDRFIVEDEVAYILLGEDRGDDEAAEIILTIDLSNLPTIEILYAYQHYQGRQSAVYGSIYLEDGFLYFCDSRDETMVVVLNVIDPEAISCADSILIADWRWVDFIVPIDPFGEENSALIVGHNDSYSGEYNQIKLVSLNISDTNYDSLSSLTTYGEIEDWDIYKDRFLYCGPRIRPDGEGQDIEEYLVNTIDFSDPSDLSLGAVSEIVPELRDITVFDLSKIVCTLSDRNHWQFILDMSEPEQIEQGEEFRLTIRTSFVKKVNNSVYCVANFDGDLSYSKTLDSLQLYELGHFHQSLHYFDFAIDDDYMFAIGKNDHTNLIHLVSLELFENDSLAEINRTYISRNHFLNSFFFRDGYAAVLSGIEGLQIIDCTNPYAPEITRKIPVQTTEFNTVFFDHEYLFLTLADETLNIYDLSQIDSPQLLLNYSERPAQIRSILTRIDDYLFVTDSQDLIHILNIDDLDNIAYVSGGDMQGSHLLIDGDRAYTSDNGINVYDISDLQDIQLLVAGDEPVIGKFRVLNNMLFAAIDSGVYIADYTYPDDIVITGFQPSETPYAISYYNDKLYSSLEFEVAIYDPSHALGLVHPPRVLLPTYNGIIAYPNPFNSQTHVSFSLPHTGSYELNLFDMNGRRLYEISRGHGLQQQLFDIPVDAASLPSGQYVLQLDNEGAITTDKVTVVR